MIALAALCLLVAPQAPAEAQAPALEVPEGFAADLVLEAPQVRWPSAVLALDDGSLLVAEDPMDMPGPTDQPIDRILRVSFDAEGRASTSVFAEGLYAVFGLEEIDGAVYVMNMPHLTVLRDTDGDGAADERVELLTDLGPPAPGFPDGFNDHIVSGIRLGMDGWLYVSVGDKGIPRATGTDGWTLSLRGGGVVRLRPDGSRLEVVARGTRNHLDVAIDARGELFTYDNTDDGLGWWTRFTHVVPGGEYGYPWLYGRHPERMLPTMIDYGGGSPCGGLVYREAAWPAELQGALFYCEWAKSRVRLLRAEPDGATFRAGEAEDFVSPGGVAEFRPLDVCESPDGRFLYVADWGFGGWRQRDVTGRLWRIRRSEDLPARPSRMAPLPRELPALVHVLGEESFRRRLRAQRALAARGEEAAPALREVLSASSSETARRHAVWALAAIGGTRNVEALALALRHGNADTRAQAAQALGDHTDPDARLSCSRCSRLHAAGELCWSEEGHGEGRVSLVPLPAAALRGALGDADATVRRRAAHALGRIGGRSVAGALAEALTSEEDPWVRWSQRTALAAAGIDAQVLLEGFARGNGQLERELLLCLREQRCDAALQVVEALLEGRSGGTLRSSAALRAATLGILDSLHAAPEPWDGTWWNIQPAKTPPPARTQRWNGSDAVAALARRALVQPEPEVRAAALAALGAMGSVEALADVRARLQDESEAVRIAALAVVEALGDRAAMPVLARLIAGEDASEELRARAIACAAALGGDESARLLAATLASGCAPDAALVACAEALGRARTAGEDAPRALEQACAHAAPSVRSAAAAALARRAGPLAQRPLMALLADPVLEVRRAAIVALGSLALPSSALALLAQAEDGDVRAEALAALARAPQMRAAEAFSQGLTAPALATREACRGALQTLGAPARELLESLCAAGELSHEQIAALRELYSAPAPLRDWSLLGPIPRKGEGPRVEELADLDLALPVPWSGGELEWRAHHTRHPRGLVDLEALLSRSSEIAAYALCTLVSEREREALMHFGSDDTLTVWVNGEQVLDYAGFRAWAPDQERARVRLRRGPNRLLLRIGQGGGQWSFSAELEGEGGGPLFEGAAAPQPDPRAGALAAGGDAERGARLFRDERGVACIRCHTVAGEGQRVGPDLSDVGARYGREELLRSLLEPSQRIAEGYRAVSLELEDGRMLHGQVQREDETELVLVTSAGELVSLDPREVVARSLSALSIMPEGFDKLVSAQELADLVSYLESLRDAPSAER